MPNNEGLLTNTVDSAIAYAKEVRKHAKTVDQLFVQAKNSVKWWINDIKKRNLETWKKLDNKINSTIVATKDTYRDVSNSVKNNIDIWYKNTKEIAKNALNYAENKVLVFENFKQQLAVDTAKWIIKWITFTKETGIMVIDYGTKKINVFVGNTAQEIAQVKNEIAKWTISAINYVQNASEVAVTVGKKTIKIWLVAAIGTWVIIYKWGKYIVNWAINTSVNTWHVVVNEVKKGYNNTKNKYNESYKSMKNDFVAINSIASWAISKIDTFITNISNINQNAQKTQALQQELVQLKTDFTALKQEKKTQTDTQLIQSQKELINAQRKLAKITKELAQNKVPQKSIEKQIVTTASEQAIISETTENSTIITSEKQLDLTPTNTQNRIAANVY